MGEEILAAWKYFGTFGGFGALSLPIAIIFLRVMHRSPIVQDALAINVRLAADIERLSRENEECRAANRLCEDRVDELRGRILALEREKMDMHTRMFLLERRLPPDTP